MGLRESRNKTKAAILEGRFVTNVLERNGRKIDQDIQKRMNAAAFKSPFWRNRDFNTVDNKLTYTHLKQHRFVDMKTRQTSNGVIRKKNYRTHNQIIFGHSNNIVRELTFGFRDSVLATAQNLDTKQI